MSLIEPSNSISIMNNLPCFHNSAFSSQSLIKRTDHRKAHNPCRPPLLQRDRHHLSPTFRCIESTARENTSLRHKGSSPIVTFVTPDGICNTPQEAVRLSEAVLETPSTFVQIRDSKADQESLHNLVKTLMDTGIPTERLIVNNLSPKVVHSLNPSLGVHVKQYAFKRDLSSALHQSLSYGSIVGCAVHSLLTAQEALQIESQLDDSTGYQTSGSLKRAHIDYMQIGTMFQTKSHPSQIPQGPALLRQISALTNGRKTILIGVGGIDHRNAAEVIRNGGDGVAVIRYISEASNPANATRILMNVLQDAYFRSK